MVVLKNFIDPNRLPGSSMELRILNSKGRLLFSCTKIDGVLLPVVARRLVWALNEGGCDSLETYQDFLSATRGVISAEDVAVRYGYDSFTLLGLGLLYFQVGPKQERTCMWRNCYRAE